MFFFGLISIGRLDRSDKCRAVRPVRRLKSSVNMRENPLFGRIPPRFKAPKLPQTNLTTVARKAKIAIKTHRTVRLKRPFSLVPSPGKRNQWTVGKPLADLLNLKIDLFGVRSRTLMYFDQAKMNLLLNRVKPCSCQGGGSLVEPSF